MALIKCEECGREISDKVNACPHCGYPMGGSEKENTQKNEKKPKKINKGVFWSVLSLIIVGVIGGIIYYSTVVKPNQVYENAIGLLEKGKYEEAEILLEKIPQHQDVESVVEQMKYESIAYTCITDFKKYLKNPDSFQPYEIEFFIMEDGEGLEDKKPICIMNYGAQNGFGGNTTGYALVMYLEETGYTTIGTSDSLDASKIDKDEEDELLVCRIINLYKETGKKVGDIDMARIKTVLKNDAYSTIKIIE